MYIVYIRFVYFLSLPLTKTNVLLQYYYSVTDLLVAEKNCINSSFHTSFIHLIKGPKQESSTAILYSATVNSFLSILTPFRSKDRNVKSGLCKAIAVPNSV